MTNKKILFSCSQTSVSTRGTCAFQNKEPLKDPLNLGVSQYILRLSQYILRVTQYTLMRLIPVSLSIHYYLGVAAKYRNAVLCSQVCNGALMHARNLSNSVKHNDEKNTVNSWRLG